MVLLSPKSLRKWNNAFADKLTYIYNSLGLHISTNIKQKMFQSSPNLAHVRLIYILVCCQNLKNFLLRFQVIKINFEKKQLYIKQSRFIYQKVSEILSCAITLIGSENTMGLDEVQLTLISRLYTIPYTRTIIWDYK